MSDNQPSVNLIVVRSADIERSATFYQTLGIKFLKHRHGNGPEHYAAKLEATVFEIYPLAAHQTPTTTVRIGFSIANLDDVVHHLNEIGVKLISAPTISEWGRRAVVKDFDGHTVELLEKEND